MKSFQSFLQIRGPAAVLFCFQELKCWKSFNGASHQIPSQPEGPGTANLDGTTDFGFNLEKFKVLIWREPNAGHLQTELGHPNSAENEKSSRHRQAIVRNMGKW